ncbi:pyridoxal phosphate-dependent aminotransferase [Hydrogenophilus islandicus]
MIPSSPFAPRVQEIAPFHVMELLRRAQALERAGHDVIHMEVGEPDFPTPEPVVAAAERFLRERRVPYTSAAGLPELREAIAADYRERLGVTLPPERIVVTAGASAALTLALALTTRPGDEWLLPDPSYPCNRHLIRLFEGRARLIPVDATHRFQPTPDEIAAAWTPQSRGVLLASPSNPTGTMLTPEEAAALACAVRDRGGLLLLDEIYQGLTFDAPRSTLLRVVPDAFVVNSFSKYFGMTGWRLGWLVCPDETSAREAEKLAQHLYIAPSTVAQYAALAAFTPETLTILEARRAAFAERRQVLLDGLSRLNLAPPAAPQGAFYAYVDITPLGQDADHWAHRFLEEAFVAVTPGRDFGEHQAGHYLRFAYTTQSERITEACARLQRLLQG